MSQYFLAGPLFQICPLIAHPWPSGTAVSIQVADFGTAILEPRDALRVNGPSLTSDNKFYPAVSFFPNYEREKKSGEMSKVFNKLCGRLGPPLELTRLNGSQDCPPPQYPPSLSVGYNKFRDRDVHVNSDNQTLLLTDFQHISHQVSWNVCWNALFKQLPSDVHNDLDL